MSANDADQDDTSLTMMDVLEEQEALQEDADAVLGAGDDEHCTYNKSYMTRQAVYACLTCCPVGGAGGRAGVCLACSLHCHATHNLVELYTKRNFCCDCGNSKFVMTPCKLTPDKDATNPQNSYSQNFDGLYCKCHRPYPDPEQPEGAEDEMIQCCHCEDWYHSKHLGGAKVPADDQFSEMICPDCVAHLPFLQDYTALAVTAVVNGDTEAAVSVEAAENEDHCAAVKEKSAALSAATLQDTKQQEDGQTNKVTEKDVQIPNTQTKDQIEEETEQKGLVNGTATKGCTAGKHRGLAVVQGALFLPEDWRRRLCTCQRCMSEYVRLEASHLCSTEDSISHYEQQSRQRRTVGRQSSVERELQALDSVDRVTRTEMVAEYNTLSSELRDYLRQFAASGRVVTGDNIKEFFAGLHARKKMRVGEGCPPAVCKW